MSILPDGTNPYGRMLDLMKNSSQKSEGGLMLGQYLGNKKFQVGEMTLERKDYLMLTSKVELDGVSFNIPGLKKKKHTVTRSVTDTWGKTETFSFDFVVPGIKKGDQVIAYQLGDGAFVILGRVVDKGGDEDE